MSENILNEITPFASLTALQAQELMKTEGTLTIDVRTLDEFKAGHIKGAQNLDYYSDDFEEKLEDMDRQARYFIYCQSGSRSSRVIGLMREMGFKNVYDMRGGFMSWKREGLSVEV